MCETSKDISSNLKQLSELLDQLKEISFKNVNKRSDDYAVELCQQISKLSVELSANFSQKLPDEEWDNWLTPTSSISAGTNIIRGQIKWMEKESTKL